MDSTGTQIASEELNGDYEGRAQGGGIRGRRRTGTQSRENLRRPYPQTVDRNLPADVSVPPDRRSRNPAQAAAENFLPDLGRRARGPASGCRAGRETRVRLVLSLLSRSRAVPCL